jgi:hypothetical protein
MEGGKGRYEVLVRHHSSDDGRLFFDKLDIEKAKTFKLWQDLGLLASPAPEDFVRSQECKMVVAGRSWEFQSFVELAEHGLCLVLRIAIG